MRTKNRMIESLAMVATWATLALAGSACETDQALALQPEVDTDAAGIMSTAVDADVAAGVDAGGAADTLAPAVDVLAPADVDPSAECGPGWHRVDFYPATNIYCAPTPGEVQSAPCNGRDVITRLGKGIDRCAL